MEAHTRKIKELRDLLRTDQQILTIAGLTSQEAARNIKSGQKPASLTDNKVKICIWPGISRPVDSKRERRTLNIDIYVPLDLEASSGVSLELKERLIRLLNNFRLGTGLKYGGQSSAPFTTSGWWKTSVSFWYHYITS